MITTGLNFKNQFPMTHDEHCKLSIENKFSHDDLHGKK